MDEDTKILVDKYKKDLERMEKDIKHEKDIMTLGHLRNSIRFVKKLIFDMENE
jgi:hypothetical protein